MTLRAGLQVLRNKQYHHPRRAVMRPSERNHWTFSCNGVKGVSLSDAYEGRPQGLDEGDEELFPADFVKVSFLISVHGYVKYRRIKNVQRTRGGVPLPTSRRRVVECVAEAIVVFLKQAKTTSDHDGSFVFGPADIQLKDLYLLELYRFGKTLVPVLGYMPLDVGPPFQ
ncbi:uncharacterized protein PHACADRAFT_122523, partial [Phanerochaete carnosa HHB-10118-sp]